MSTTLENAVAKYLNSANRACGMRKQFRTTLKKWLRWGSGVAIENLGRKEIRELLDWVYENAVAQEGTNPGRTTNMAREHLRAVISWAWDQDLIEVPPRFPKPRTRRGWPTLFDQDRDQYFVLRDAQDEASERLEEPDTS